MILVQTRDQFDAALKILMQASIISVDTETSGLRPHDQGHRLCGISTHCVMPGAEQYAVNFYFPFRHAPPDKQINLFTVSENLPIEWLPEFAQVFNRSDVLLKLWHFKYDAQIFRLDGLWIDPNMNSTDDGMIKAQLIDENTSHRLKDQGAATFGEHVRAEEEEILKLVKKTGGYHKTTPQQMAPYACRDAQLTHDLDPILDKRLAEQNLTHLVRRDMYFQRVLLELEWKGIGLDKELAMRLSRQSRDRMREIEDELNFDPQSKLQLSHVLFGSSTTGGLELPYEDRTKNTSKEFPMGIPKMDEAIMVGLRHPIADLVLEYRGLQKANSTWYQGWLDRMGPDGRIHPSYNVSEKKEKYGTVTSRLSSYIQQMPRDPSAMVKLLLQPDKGYLMVEADYSQIEYREAACYSKDQDLIDQFKSGADTHQILAEELTKVLGQEIDRQSAKQTAYTIAYGGQGHALAINLMKQVWLNEKRVIYITDEQGQEIVDVYYRLHPKMKAVSKLAAHNASKYGFVTLWNGRRRHFYKHEPWTFRKAFNSVLQGGAAQILVESMLMLHDRRAKESYEMRLQVHDSLWFEIPEDRYDHCTEAIRKIMEWPSKKFPVPFPIEFKTYRGHVLEESGGDLLSVGSRSDDGVGSI